MPKIDSHYQYLIILPGSHQAPPKHRNPSQSGGSSSEAGGNKHLARQSASGSSSQQHSHPSSAGSATSNRRQSSGAQYQVRRFLASNGILFVHSLDEQFRSLLELISCIYRYRLKLVTSLLAYGQLEFF